MQKICLIHLDKIKIKKYMGGKSPFLKRKIFSYIKKYKIKK